MKDTERQLKRLHDDYINEFMSKEEFMCKVAILAHTIEEKKDKKAKELLHTILHSIK